MKKLFPIFIAILIFIETGLIFISMFFDFTENETKEISFLEVDPAWADTLISHMNLDEKIGQLIFLELENAQNDSVAILDSMVTKQMIGGIKFKQTELVNQLIITNFLQSVSKYPLLIGSEGSIINRADFDLPIGSIINAKNDSVFADLYLNNFSSIIKQEGVQIEFSNSIDILDSVDSNYEFSDNREKVKHQASFFRKSLYINNLISCVNFKDEAFFEKDLTKIDSLCLLKTGFQLDKYFAIQQDPQITKAIIEKKTDYSFSNFYKTNYNFNGLVFSNIHDSINNESLGLLLKSGTDIMIATNNIEKIISRIKELVEENDIHVSDIDKKVKRILMAKKWAGLDKPKFRSVEHSLAKIYSQNGKLLSWQLYENSVCLIKNQSNTIPFEKLINSSSQILTFGQENFAFFQEYLNYYSTTGSLVFDDKTIQKKLYPYKNIIVAIDRQLNVNSSDSLLFSALTQLSKTKKIIILNFGNPSNINKLQFAHVILHAYNKHPLSQIVMAQAIAGSIPPAGIIVPKLYASKTKPNYSKIDRFQYTVPEAAGFSSAKLSLIDTLIEEAISIGATPGCQILAAKNGKVFYNKSFGHHIYWGNTSVKNLDLYDLASITKVAATTLASMKLYEQGKIELDDSIKYYIDDTIHCTIKNHQLRDFFIHQSGLQPNMPVLQYINYRKKGIGRFDVYFSNKKDSNYTLEVAKDFYLKKNYLDSITFSLYNMPWDTTKPYQYSDINLNIIFDVIQRKIKDDYVKYLNVNFYNPLQLRSTGFLPIERFSEERIAPTQEDKYWRKQLLCGTPHDESAALYGGIAGNAGLFSNANDLAILFQMLLNGGKYGGKKILQKETIEYFTKTQENSNRGLGFAWNQGFFGHTGFTGCAVWANPKTKIVFVFLSNSIYPKPANQKLKQMKIRSRVLNLILSAYKPEVLEQINEE